MDADFHALIFHYQVPPQGNTMELPYPTFPSVPLSHPLPRLLAPHEQQLKLQPPPPGEGTVPTIQGVATGERKSMVQPGYMDG